MIAAATLSHCTASLADLSVVTLREFENGRARLHVNHRQALAAILSAAGVQFDADAGKA
jgi:hypothetical protein